MFCFVYYFGSEDEKLYEHLKANYVEIERDQRQSDANRFLVSEFLKSKLEGYLRVEYIQGLVWKADNNVIKMYWDKHEFEHAVKMQDLVVSCGMGCKLLDTWINEKNGEYFTISEYGGKPLGELYKEEYAIDLSDKIGEQLESFGLIHNDLHIENCVEKDGVIRIIDYESISQTTSYL